MITRNLFEPTNLIALYSTKLNKDMKVVFLFPFLMSITTYCFGAIGESIGSLTTIGNTHTNVVLSIDFSNDSIALEKLNSWKEMLTSSEDQIRLNSLRKASDYLSTNTVSNHVHRSFFDFFLTGIEDQNDYVRSRAINYVDLHAKRSDFKQGEEEHLLLLLKDKRLFVDRLFAVCAKYRVEKTFDVIQATFTEKAEKQLFKVEVVSGDDPDWVVWNAASSLAIWDDPLALQFLLETSKRLLIENRSFVLKTLAKRLLNIKSRPLGVFVIEEFIYSDYCGKSDVLSCDYEVASFLLLYPTIAEFKAFVDGYFAKSQTPSKAQIQTWFQENRDTWTYAEN